MKKREMYLNIENYIVMIGIYGLGNIGLSLLAYLNKKHNQKIIAFTNNPKNLGLTTIFSHR